MFNNYSDANSVPHIVENEKYFAIITKPSKRFKIYFLRFSKNIAVTNNLLINLLAPFELVEML